MSGGLVAAIVTALLGGGLVGGVASFITGRAIARKTAAETTAINAKVPAEVDSVIVAGAETAVLTMQKALQSAERRIAQLEREQEADRKTIETLRLEVAELKVTATSAVTKATRLEQRLEEMARQHNGRH